MVVEIRISVFIECVFLILSSQPVPSLLSGEPPPVAGLLVAEDVAPRGLQLFLEKPFRPTFTGNRYEFFDSLIGVGSTVLYSRLPDLIEELIDLGAARGRDRDDALGGRPDSSPSGLPDCGGVCLAGGAAGSDGPLGLAADPGPFLNLCGRPPGGTHIPQDCAEGEFSRHFVLPLSGRSRHREGHPHWVALSTI